MKIAHFSPLPPDRTGVADYCWELLPELARLAEVDVWRDPLRDAPAPCGCRLIDWRDSARLSGQLSTYDAVIYHLGNSRFHQEIYRAFLQSPGVVVMHDFVLHHFFAECFLPKESSRYLEEMGYNYGLPGKVMAKDLIAGNMAPLWETQPLQFPLNKRVLDLATGVIVHSEFTKRLVLQTHSHLPVAQINFPWAETGEKRSTEQLKERYGLPKDRVIVASFGMTSPHKRITTVLRALARLRNRHFIYLLVGELTDDVRSAVRDFGLEAIVRPAGYVTADIFEDYCSMADVCVNLRFPTYGETSASLCKLMGSGKACIVSDLGWFAELPDDCVAKIGVNEYEEDMTLAWLDRLISSEALRNAIGSNAQKYMLANHSLSSTATQYVKFLNEVNRRKSQRRFDRNLIKDVAETMVRLGITDQDHKLVDGPSKILAQLLT